MEESEYMIKVWNTQADLKLSETLKLNDSGVIIN